MNRIKKLFSKDSKKLIVFITAGFPKKDSTKELVLEAIKADSHVPKQYYLRLHFQ